MSENKLSTSMTEQEYKDIIKFTADMENIYKANKNYNIDDYAFKNAMYHVCVKCLKLSTKLRMLFVMKKTRLN